MDNKHEHERKCNGGCHCEGSSSETLKAETNTKMSSGCNKKDAGDNAWTSVAQNYDIAESCEKHKKDEGNNQWCSTCK